LTVANDPSAAPRPLRDLKVRVASGLALAIVAIGLTWASAWTFTVLVAGVALVVAWEWGRIVRGGGVDAIFIVHAVVVVAAILLAALGQAGLALLTVLVGCLLAILLGFDVNGRVSAFGVVYAGLPAVALVWFRSSTPLGFEAVLFLLLAVWATDTGAYAAGRLIGGARLLPRVSPNKTWSGLAGGVTAAGAVGFAFAAAVAGANWRTLVPTAVAIAVVAQIGDLMESALKRRHDVKDASGLIPGHGGFMDRVDGLILAAFAAALFSAIVNVRAPGSALLLWR
jgi:phosphatidate cytidylyltransferase